MASRETYMSRNAPYETDGRAQCPTWMYGASHVVAGGATTKSPAHQSREHEVCDADEEPDWLCKEDACATTWGSKASASGSSVGGRGRPQPRVSAPTRTRAGHHPRPPTPPD